MVQRGLCRLGYDLRPLWVLAEGEYVVCCRCSWQESAAFCGLAVEEALSHTLESYITRSGVGLSFFPLGHSRAQTRLALEVPEPAVEDLLTI